MISNSNNSLMNALGVQVTSPSTKTTGQNVPGGTSAQDKILEKGFKAYVRELQMEKLEEEARQKAMRKLHLTDEKLEKIKAASPQKYEEITQNIQDYVSDYLTKEAMAQLDQEAQEQGLPGYNKGMLVDITT